MLLLLSACSGRTSPGAGRPVVLLTLDTVRADRLGCYGRAGAATPNLDRLAREGARFDRAYTPAPITLPAHASMLTGLYPNRHGLRDNGIGALPASAPTLATILRERGYETAAFVSGAPLDRRFGLARGFDTYDDALSGRAAAATFAERSADRTTESALRWLAPRLSAPRRRPFLLWIHYFDPHAPYAPPSPFADRFAHEPYEGEIAFVDSEIGRLLAALERAGALDEALVAAVADHGEGLGEHGERTHSTMLYDSTLRVPWLLRAPGKIAPGTLRTDRAATVDLLPTLLALLDLPAPRDLDGSDRSKDAASSSSTPLMAESLNPYHQWGWAPQLAARDPRSGEKRMWDGPDRFTTMPDESPGEPPRRTTSPALDRALDVYASTRETEATADPRAPAAVLLSLGYLGTYAPLPPASRFRDLPAVSTRLRILDAIDAAGAERDAGRPDSALALLEEAARLDPSNPGLRFYLGHLRRNRAHALLSGDPDRTALLVRALVDLDAAAAARPADPRTVSLCASVQIELGSIFGAGEPERGRELYESASARLEAILEIHPDDVAASFLLAVAHSPGSPIADVERSCRALTRVLDLEPAHANARALRAEIGCR